VKIPVAETAGRPKIEYLFPVNALMRSFPQVNTVQNKVVMQSLFSAFASAFKQR
jgi:hypothetical protein